MKKCPKCNGTGEVLDNEEVGMFYRVHRTEARKSLQAIADILGLSKAYCSDLELGRRAWRPELMEKYRRAIYGEKK